MSAGRNQTQSWREVDSLVEEAQQKTGYRRMLHEFRGGGRYIDLEKDTQFSDAWVVLGILLTLVGLALNSRFLTAAALSLFVIMMASGAWSQLSLFGLHYRRQFSETRAFLGETIELTLEVRNQKLLPLTWLDITDVFSATLPLDRSQVVINRITNLGEFRTFWMLGAFQRLTRHFTIQCAQRGYHTYGPATINTGDGFGLFSRKALTSQRDCVIVYPRLYSMAELRLPAKNPFGERGSPLRLFEDPLRTVGIREWQSGDSLRRVHWKATARHQQMLSRAYEPSEEPQALIVLNVATLTRHWLGNIPELQERAISVASSLAALCTELRLPVGLIANGYLPGSDQSISLLPGRSPNQLVRILELLAAITALATQPIEKMIWHEAPRLPWGATLLVVTAIAHDDLLATLQDLSQAGRQIVLFTLAEEPPARQLPGVLVYHLPHLVDDLIIPQKVIADAAN
ncbi:MAG: DUF58 domain-containing protein [Anaerolineales bacterium]|nr:MAG: DUF58 domain-containing protein [Anaerolineales bacterium]